MTLKQWKVALLVTALVTTGAVAPVSAAQEEPPPVWRSDVTGAYRDAFPLLGLIPGGQTKTLHLTGLNNSQFFDFGVHDDDLVSEARLMLNVTASPALIPTRSQLNVYLNGQLQKSVPVTEEWLGKVASVEVTLDPKLIKKANQISFEFVGHYQNICETPTSETLWLDVNAPSQLILQKQKIKLSSDLARLPAPFVDVSTNRSTTLPVVFASAPDNQTKTAAAVLASLCGRAAQWRGVDFPVYYNQLPAEGHFVVFVTNENRPHFLKDMPVVQGPQISITDVPNSRYAKMLVIAGRNSDDLVMAVRALTEGDQVLIGDKLLVKDVKELPRRRAYDAPNWINVEDGAVSFNQLMQYTGQLSSRGYAPPPVHLSMRLAPDLYMVGGSEVNSLLKYRYTKPQPGDYAQVRMHINNILVDSINANGDATRGQMQLRLPGFEGYLVDSLKNGYAFSAQNDLSFSVAYTHTFSEGSADNCKSAVLLPHQLEIDPTSTISMEGLYHYAQLPNLTLFTQSGFPFTKYADLAETTVLIPQSANAEEMTTLLNTIGRLGSITGYPATKVTITSEVDARALKDKDIIRIGALPSTLTDLQEDNAAQLQNAIAEELKGGASNTEELEALSIAQSLITPDNGIGAIVSLQSPFSSARTVVALGSEGERGAFLLNDRLKNPSSLATMTGSVGIITDSEVLSFKVGETYHVGYLPWYHQIWQTISNYPLLLVLCALVCAVLVGGGIFYFMRLWIRRRS